MHGGSLIQDLILLYALALVVLFVGGRLRVPVIVSLIVTGIAAGPGGLGFVREQETVSLLSEIGIALLLFMVGLDLSFSELRRLWRSVVGGGSAQVLGTMAVTVPFAWLWFGPDIEALTIVGLFVALSSTSIIVRELTRQNELHSPHGGLAIGVLLLQDLLALAALVMLPAFFGTAGAPGVGRALLQIVLIAAGLAVVTRVFLPVLFRLATASGREAFGLMVLVASVGTAWLASVLGLSMTVGAFLAGLVIDESEFSHQIHAEIRPLRDLLTSLFFMSVGLQVVPAVVAPVAPLVVAVAAGIVVLKTVGATLSLLLARVPMRVAGTAALGLAQIGEFSFVLGKDAVDHAVIGPADWQVLLGASVLTMMATPRLVAVAPRFGGWLAERGSSGDAARGTPEPLGALTRHVVILGFGAGGRLIAGSLRGIETPHIILELNGKAVQEGVAAGHRIRYGDATAAEPLHAAGVDRASAVVAVLSDPGATERAVRTVRALNPHVPIVVRTRYRLEADRMMQAGATLAVAEELEASLEVLAQLLVRLDVPGNVTEVLVAGARRAARVEDSPRTPWAPQVASDVVAGAVARTPVVSYRLTADDGAIGRTLGDMNLRAETGATVLAVRRGAATQATPPADWVFEAGDIVYLAGDDSDIRLARARLAQGVGAVPWRAGPSPDSPPA